MLIFLLSYLDTVQYILYTRFNEIQASVTFITEAQILHNYLIICFLKPKPKAKRPSPATKYSCVGIAPVLGRFALS